MIPIYYTPSKDNHLYRKHSHIFKKIKLKTVIHCVVYLKPNLRFVRKNNCFINMIDNKVTILNVFTIINKNTALILGYVFV